MVWVRYQTCYNRGEIARGASRRTIAPSALAFIHLCLPYQHTLATPLAMMMYCSWAAAVMMYCSWAAVMIVYCSWAAAMMVYCSWAAAMMVYCSWAAAMMVYTPFVLVGCHHDQGWQRHCKSGKDRISC